MIKILLNTKLKGGALYYAIFIMIILGMLSIFFLSYFELSYREDMMLYKYEELNDNINSALVKISCFPEILPESGDFELDVFDDTEALIQLSTSRWGMMQKVIATANWKHINKSKVVLLAEQEKTHPALWMPERNRYLSLVGNSQLIGDIYLSELGVRSANIEGLYFEGNKLYEGNLHVSDDKLPQLNDEFVYWVHNYIEGNINDSDSVINFGSLKENYSLKRTFASNTLVLQSAKKISLELAEFNDNLIIVSSDTIEVWPSAALNDVVLIAEVIVFKKGFEGRLQAYAKQSMLVEDNCSFLYPSFIGALNSSPQVEVTIGDGFRISGGVICFSQKPEEDKTITTIENAKEIIGKIYTNGDINIKGKVTGGLYCNRFIYQTPRAFYENFMIDLIIDAHSLPESFASFCVGKEREKLKIVRRCQHYSEK